MSRQCTSCHTTREFSFFRVLGATTDGGILLQTCSICQDWRCRSRISVWPSDPLLLKIPVGDQSLTSRQCTICYMTRELLFFQPQRLTTDSDRLLLTCSVCRNQCHRQRLQHAQSHQELPTESNVNQVPNHQDHGINVGLGSDHQHYDVVPSAVHLSDNLVPQVPTVNLSPPELPPPDLNPNLLLPNI